MKVVVLYDSDSTMTDVHTGHRISMQHVANGVLIIRIYDKDRNRVYVKFYAKYYTAEIIYLE